jgi:hypothetical protein
LAQVELGSVRAGKQRGVSVADGDVVSQQRLVEAQRLGQIRNEDTAPHSLLLCTTVAIRSLAATMPVESAQRHFVRQEGLRMR